MIELDGSIGGGGVVRAALGLSVATGTPFRVDNVRAERPDPGLKHQHLAGVTAAAALSGAAVEGGELGSQELVFSPSGDLDGTVQADIPTAGSVGLLLQPLWIAAAAAGHEVAVTVDGGATAGKWAPPVHYLQHVAFPIMERFGLPASLDVRRHGFYPEGGALVGATFGPADLERVELGGRGDIDTVHGRSIASQHLQDAEVADRQRDAARAALKDDRPSLDCDIDVAYVQAPSPGSSIVLWADAGETVVGGDCVGEKGKRSEAVGREAADELLAALAAGTPVDAAMADLLVPFLGLAGGAVSVPAVTDHVECSVAVTDRFVEADVRIEQEAARVVAE